MSAQEEAALRVLVGLFAVNVSQSSHQGHIVIETHRAVAVRTVLS